MLLFLTANYPLPFRWQEHHDFPLGNHPSPALGLGRNSFVWPILIDYLLIDYLLLSTIDYYVEPSLGSSNPHSFSFWALAVLFLLAGKFFTQVFARLFPFYHLHLRSNITSSVIFDYVN